MGCLTLGKDPPDAELQSMFKEVDKDNSGFIDENEFIELMALKMKTVTDSKESLMEAFKVFDIDNSGSITKQELKETMMSLGDKLSEEEAEEMMKEAKGVDNGVGELAIDYEK